MIDRCAMCGGDSKVIETRPSKIGIWRRRLCLTCGLRWSTYEVPKEIIKPTLKDLARR